SATDSDGSNTADIAISAGGTSSLTVDKCVLKAARYGIAVQGGGTNVSALTVSNNTISDHVFQVEVGFDGTSTVGAINIGPGNDMSDNSNWQYPGNTGPSPYHTNGFFSGSTGSGTINIFGNYFHGNLGCGGGGNCNTTSFTTCTGNGGASVNSIACRV